MRQAIVTKYHGPTNSSGSRVSARAQAGRKVYHWDHALGVEDNHRKAAIAFAEAYGWLTAYEIAFEEECEGSRIVGGALPDGTGYAFVILDRGPVGIVEGK